MPNRLQVHADVKLHRNGLSRAAKTIDTEDERCMDALPGAQSSSIGMMIGRFSRDGLFVSVHFACRGARC